MLNKTIKTINFNSYEEATKEYNNLLNVCTRAKELGFLVNYNLVKEGIEFKILIKHSFSLN